MICKPITSYQLLVTNHQLQITVYKSQITIYQSPNPCTDPLASGKLSEANLCFKNFNFA
jgi:hypothetical protein